MSRPVLYPLRSVDSAVVCHTDAPYLRRRITIDHRPLAGVTPAMLLDWFRNLDGTMSYGGQVVDRYLAWHPIDHVRWELARPARGGGAAEGARFRIVEKFGGQDRFAVDVVDRVEKLDETGIRLVQRVAGAAVFQLEHTWSAGPDGAHYVTVMDIGARSAALMPVNYVLTRRFPDEMARAWVKHNIEEVGQLEHLLPSVGPGQPWLPSVGPASPSPASRGRQVNRNQRSAATAASTPQTASTASPNQSTDIVTA